MALSIKIMEGNAMKNEENHQQKKGKAPGNFRDWQMPDTYVIIFFVVAIAALLTYLVPVGQFDVREVTYMQDGSEQSREVLDPDTFQLVTTEDGEALREGIRLFEPFGGVGFLNYVFEGLVSGSKWGTAVGIIAFILVIGGAFGIILRTGAVENAILAMIKRTKGMESLSIPIIFFFFSLGGAVFGMGEEAIPFAMILVPLMIAMGYDAITGICITYVATQIGFATSWMNPFSLAVAQGVSGIPVLSGAGFRIALWAFFTALGIGYTYRYAQRIRKDPTKSLSYESDAYYRNDFEGRQHIETKFGTGDALVLLTIVVGVIWVVWGVMQHAYYIPEIATQFFVMGLVAGMIGVIFRLKDMRVNDIAISFRNGAKELVGAAMVVGMAQGIILVLGGTDPTAGTVLNTILHYAGNAVGSLPPAVSAWIMFVFQSVFNFFVVSGSGQAALVMPLMAPLADIVGVSRQVAVLAFQLGDGFTNLIVPTSGCLMGVLGVAKLDWYQWFRFQIKFQVLLFVLASLVMVLAVMIGFN